MESCAFWLIISHCRADTQIGYGKQHKFPDSEGKSCCQNNQTQVLNNLLLWNLDLTKAKGMTTLVRYNEVSLYRGSFSYILLLSGVKKIVRYIEGPL